MDISSIGAGYSEIVQAAKAEEQSQVEAMYAVKLIKMAQQSAEVVGALLEDTAEISKEAMEKFMSERG